MEQKKTLIIGASTNPSRYSYLAAQMLTQAGHPIVNIGIDKGELFGEPIKRAEEPHNDIHSITLYISPRLQPQYYDYIIGTKPQRIIFNPGTENKELRDLAEQAGIETIEACTLVLIRTGQF